MSSFSQFFDSQMAIFRRVRCEHSERPLFCAELQTKLYLILSLWPTCDPLHRVSLAFWVPRRLFDTVSNLVPKWVRLAQNRTNPRLFPFRLQYILTHQNFPSFRFLHILFLRTIVQREIIIGKSIQTVRSSSFKAHSGLEFYNSGDIFVHG